MEKPYGTTAREVLDRMHLLPCADWSAWSTLWRYASDNGLMTRAIDNGTNAAEAQRRPSADSLASAKIVTDHAMRSLTTKAS